jgi:hypothetical protein
MAEVYRARDERLKREVALKMVTEALSSDPDLLRRFEQESRLAGSLNHPNLVAVHDVGVHEGTPYFVTELLRGESLRSRLARGPVPTSTALDWATQMARGLAAAHGRGIVHRDVKPDNVFVCSDGQVKLLDFGIAKLTEPAALAGTHDLMEATVTPTGGATRTGSVLGTPGYMSPEQLRGEPIDARSDIFSWAATVYEVLAGHRAFPGATLVESGYSILHKDPEPLPAEVPVPVAEVVLRCLDKDPSRRIQSASDLAFALEVVGHTTGRTGRHTSAKRRGPSRLALGALGALLVLALGTTWALTRKSKAAPRAFSHRLTFRQGSIRTAKFGPDGRTVVFSASWNGEPYRLYATTVDSPDYHPLDVEDAFVASVSASGELAILLHPRYSLGVMEGTLARMPGVGGAPRELADDVVAAAWAPDANSIAVVRRHEGQYAVEFPVGHTLYSSPNRLAHPTVSPRGDRVAFVEHPVFDDEAGNVRVVDRQGRERTVIEKWIDIRGLAWTAKENTFLLAGLPSPELGGTSLWLVSPEETKLVFPGLGFLALEDVTRDGRALIIDRDQRRDIKAQTISTAGARTERIGTYWWANLGAVSRNGASILFSDFSNGSPGDESTYLRKAQGGIPIHLGTGVPLALSPDSAWAVALPVDRPSHLRLLPTGVGAVREVEFSGLSFFEKPGVFVSNGGLVLLARNKDGLSGYLLDLERHTARRLTPPLTCCLAASPDGAYVVALPATGPVTAYPTDTGPPIPLAELGRDYWPTGWGTGGLLVREAHATLPLSVFHFDIQKRTRQLLVTLAPSDLPGRNLIDEILVSSDEKTVAYEHRRETSVAYVVDLSSVGQ